MRTKNYWMALGLFLFVFGTVLAQEKNVSGTVTDQEGLPLPGVSIIVVGTSVGTQTDFDGNYSIMASTGSTLRFSYIGQKTVERKVGASSVINVSMEEDAQALEEVVVTALGIKRKPRELSYSVASVDNSALTKTRAVNTVTALAGKVSGMQINTISNGVNPSTRIVLRGNRSLLGNNQALIVIDGFPADRNALDRLNSDDIKEISILKGGNASALYGSDAANGVVIITTKSGTGKASITFTSTAQLDNISFLPELQDEFGVGGFPDGTIRPLENVAWGPRFDGSLVDASEQYEDGRVWKVPYSPIPGNHKSFFQTGSLIRNGFEFSGGSEKSSFLFSIDHSNIEGTVPQDKFNRTNARAKGMYDFGNLQVSSNISFYRSHSNTVGVGGHQARPLYWYLLNTPLHIPINQMKNWRTGEFTRNEVSYYAFYENPWFIIDTQRNKSNDSEMIFISDANYKFTDWLSALVRVGYTKYTYDLKEYHGGLSYSFELPVTYSRIDEFSPSTRDYIYNSSRFNSDFIVTANKNLSDLLNVKANLGHNIRMTDYKVIDITGNNLIIPGFYNVSTRTGELQGSETSQNYRKVGVYGDITLSIGDFLFLNGQGRNDWSSSLSKENRSFFYPGGGISFVPTDAFKGLKGTLQYLKASFSISKTGNDPGPYSNSTTFSAPAGFPFGSTAGLTLSGTDRDPNLKPEFTKSMEAGIEFGIFKDDRLSGSFSVYQTNTTDQIVPIDISTTSGASRLYTNLGELQNQGIEVDLKGTILKSEDFSWNLGINYSLIKSEVVSLTEGVDEVVVGGPYSDNIAYGAVVVAQKGQPYPLIKTTDYERDDLGRVIVGEDGDPIPSSDLIVQGKTTPDYIVGLNSTINFKGFSLYAVADYRTGHVFYNNLVDALEFTGLTKHSATSGRQPFVFPNSVYSDGNDGYIENTNRLTSGGGNAFWSTYNDTKSNYVTDATVLKLREVSLSYAFENKLANKLGFQDLNFGIYGRNLYMWRPADNVYTDPEFNYNSGNAVGFGTQNQTAPVRQFGMTLTAKF
ncbi:SusC/RagA family TonB-linked outer membrane protein [Flagellimonas sediminis]|uniref:SusC/RagA family TonB-linked outer membrane protein n=1 Tax=Flagellimonas sediminis TaxID=2696468 RepID=A0A6I5KTK5_9FLAO|nr:SusC/RagA family TonB-linked outer membrane protein [Allomuricauda sediminis]NDV44264.1 SusC/RagA family TonB-linked outer membrane protein [Allomuricauda sediminis]